MTENNARAIPNLLTSSRFSRPSRGRGRGGHASSNDSHSISKATNSDTTIRATDDDAAGSRLSAVDAGYLVDEFAEVFWDGAEGAGGSEGIAKGVGASEQGRPRAEGRPRRMPIINRGTYVRTTAIDKLVLEFITKHTQPSATSTPSNTSHEVNNPSSSSSTSAPSTPTTPTPSQLQHPQSQTTSSSAATHSQRKVQIVSLGAGTDTRYFRLLNQYPYLRSQIIYHELDFPATTAKKVRAILRTPAIRSLLFPVAPGECANVTEYTISSARYNIHALDLRDLVPAPDAPSSALQSPPQGLPSQQPSRTPSPPSPPPTITLPNINPQIPTLLLSECCLTYLPVPTSTSLLSLFAHTLIPPPTPLEVVMYEPLHPDDAFGRTMQANLAARGISMPGVLGLKGLVEHEGRLRGVLGSEQRQDVEVGFEEWTVKELWDSWVESKEKERLRRCEMVDEEEEWVLLAGHYGVMRAWRG